MGVGEQEFKRALSKFASGVTIVTVSSGAERHGMTASSFASVSLDPPLVLVCLAKTSRTRALLLEQGAFAVNMLSAGQERLARGFSQPGTKPFHLSGYRMGARAPLLNGAAAWLECTIAAVLDGGDHDVVMGRVERSEASERPPLIYYERAYRSLGGS